MSRLQLSKWFASKWAMRALKPAPAKASRKLRLETLEDRVVPAGTWTALTNKIPGGNGAQTSMVLSDGTVMVHVGSGGSSSAFYRLTPDALGSYSNGTWSAMPSMSAPRLFYTSTILPDSRVLVVGGEYPSFQNTAEIYDPIANTWTSIPNVPTPDGQFGDDPTSVLPDGRVLAGYYNSGLTFIYNPATNTWAKGPNKLRGDASDEETWLKLPDGSLLSYDIFSSISSGTPRAQRYIPATNKFVDAGILPSILSRASEGYELGGAFLLPDGRAFYTGTQSNTAYYTPSTNTWAAGPVIPAGGTQSDAPGAMMNNGKILLGTSPINTNDTFPGPDTIYQLDPSTGVYTNVTPAIPGFNLGGSAFTTTMLTLPNGQVLMTNYSSQLAVYTPDSPAIIAGQATISSIVKTGANYTLAGTGLNGITEGASYGDDNEMATNYPLVKLQDSSGKVVYGRTSNWTSTGVQTGATPSSTDFTFPTAPAPGAYLLSTTASGLPSADSYLFVQMGTGVDKVTLQIDPANPAKLRVLQNGVTVIASYNLTAFKGIIVDGSTGDDSLTLDFSNGDFYTGRDFTYDGEGGVNTLRLKGTTGTDNFQNTATGLMDNAITVNSSVYANVQAIVFDGNGGADTFDITPTAATSFLAIGGGAGNQFTYEGSGRLSFTGPTSGKMTSAGLMDVSFANIGQSITITGTFVLDLDANISASNPANNGVADTFNIVKSGGTSITVNGQSLPNLIGTMTALNIVGSADNDTLTIDDSGGFIAVPVTFAGGSGNNTFKVVGTAGIDTFTVDGNGVTIDAVSYAYTGVQTVSIVGNSPSDTYDVTPAASTAFNLQGSGTGGSLTYHGSGRFIVGIPGSATITSAGLQPVAFSGIPGTVTFTGQYAIDMSALATPANSVNNGVADFFSVSRSAGGILVSVNGSPAPSIVGTLNGIFVTGSKDDDKLTIDNSLGLINTTITFTGGGGSNSFSTFGNPGTAIKRVTVGLASAGTGKISTDPNDSAGVGAAGTLDASSQSLNFTGANSFTDVVPADEGDYFLQPNAVTANIVDGAAVLGFQTLSLTSGSGVQTQSALLANFKNLTVNGLNQSSFRLHNAIASSGMTVLNLYGQELPGGAVAAGSAANSITIGATAAGVPVNVYGQSTNDLFALGDPLDPTFANSLDGIKGAVTLNGGAVDPTKKKSFSSGAVNLSLAIGNSLTVNDLAATGNSYTLSATGAFTRTGAVPLQFNGIQTLKLQMNQGASSAVVSGTAAGTATTIVAGSGADAVSVLGTGAGSYVAVQGGVGGDAIGLDGSGAGGIVSLTGGSANDALSLGATSHTLANILGNVSVDGGGFQPGVTTTLTVGSTTNTLQTGDVLNLDDSGAAGNAYGVTSTAISRTGFANILYANVGSLNLLAGGSSDSVTVSSLMPNTSAAITTGAGDDAILVTGTGLGSNLVVNGGGGTNGFAVQNTPAGSATSLVGGSGADTFNAGNANSLIGLAGAVGFSGGAGSDILNFNDQAVAANEAYQLKSDRLSLNGGPNLAYDTMETVNLNGGAGANAYDIQGTATGANTTIADGIGNSTFAIAGGGLGGNNTILGGGGANAFTLNGGTGITATGVNISGGTSPLTDTFTVNGKTGGGTTTLSMKAGSFGERVMGLGTTVNFDSFAAVGVNGVSGTNDLNVTDDTDTTYAGVAPKSLDLLSGILYRPASATSGDLRFNLNYAAVPQSPAVTPAVTFTGINGNFTVSGDGNHSGDRDTLTVLGFSDTGSSSGNLYGETTIANARDQVAISETGIQITNATLGVLRSVSVDTASIKNLVYRAGNKTAAHSDSIVATPSKKLNILVDGMNNSGGSQLTVPTVGPKYYAHISTPSLGGPQLRISQSDTASVGYLNISKLTGAGYVVTGASVNGNIVNVYDPTDLSKPKWVLEPYFSTFKGGVRVAVGDVTGDGIPDIVTISGPGANPNVEVFDGVDASLVRSFIAYAGYNGGAQVAVGDVNGDGYADIVTGTDAGVGGGHVKVFSGKDSSLLQSFLAFAPGFLGGVSVAAGDVEGTGMADIIVGAASGTSPHVEIFRGTDLTQVASYYAFSPGFMGGVTVAAVDTNGDGKADVVVGAASGNSPHLKVFDSTTTNELASFLIPDASLPANSQGLRVAGASVDASGNGQIFVSRPGSPVVRRFKIAPVATELNGFVPFDPSLGWGVYVGGV